MLGYSYCQETGNTDIELAPLIAGAKAKEIWAAWRVPEGNSVTLFIEMDLVAVVTNLAKVDELTFGRNRPK